MAIEGKVQFFMSWYTWQKQYRLCCLCLSKSEYTHCSAFLMIPIGAPPGQISTTVIFLYVYRAQHVSYIENTLSNMSSNCPSIKTLKCSFTPIANCRMFSIAVILTYLICWIMLSVPQIVTVVFWQDGAAHLDILDPRNILWMTLCILARGMKQ